MRHPLSQHRHGRLSSRQLTSKTWPEFDRFFASNGGVWGGCWCMFFHAPGKFDPGAYDVNRRTKQDLVMRGKAHSTLVYCGSDPVGWCQFGPKDELQRVDKKRGYMPTSENPWRITCLFVSPSHRRSGVATFAVKESVKAMRGLKAESIEAYPVEGERSASSLWMGTPHLFESAGFEKVGPLGKGSWIYSLTTEHS